MKITEIKHFKVLTATVLVLFLASCFLYTRSEAFSNYRNNILAKLAGKEFNQQVTCLATNLYYEARGESYQGQLAVAQVTVNRVNSGEFPGSVCGVVYQRDTQGCQFSWVCQPHPAIIDDTSWQKCVRIAKMAMTEPYVYASIYKQDALYYHANTVHPAWNKTLVAVVGNHLFYKERYN